MCMRMASVPHSDRYYHKTAFDKKLYIPQSRDKTFIAGLFLIIVRMKKTVIIELQNKSPEA